MLFIFAISYSVSSRGWTATIEHLTIIVSEGCIFQGTWFTTRQSSFDIKPVFFKAFACLFFPLSQEKLDVGVRKEVDGMGTSEIKYGDSVCFIQHISTGLWLTYQSVDVKSVRMGSIQRKVRMYKITVYDGHS